MPRLRSRRAALIVLCSVATVGAAGIAAADAWQPRRAIDVFGALFSRSTGDAHFLSLATGESLAHLNYLVARGEASISMMDGVARYQLVGT